MSDPRTRQDYQNAPEQDGALGRYRRLWRALREVFDNVIDQPPGWEAWTPEQQELWREMCIDAGRLARGAERFRESSGF